VIGVSNNGIGSVKVKNKVIKDDDEGLFDDLD
jgi:hypothetical protein